MLYTGQSYTVVESDVPSFTGIGIQDNGFYCRDGGNAPGNGCINPGLEAREGEGGNEGLVIWNEEGTVILGTGQEGRWNGTATIYNA